MSLQTEAAYKYIKERILDGTYKPSQKLIEAQLSEDVGVSRNTIKKALLMLQRENLVELESNKGATIKSYSMDEIINYLEIREVLEGLVARNAANKITDADLQTLGELMQQMKQHIEENEFEKYSQLNQKFHEIIYTASKNKPAVELIHIIKNQLSRIQFRTILVPGRNQESLKEHIRIYEALQTRNEKEASAAIEQHIRAIQKVIVQNYQFLQ
ncbi:GntR family transcriptional regulator [Brevibacillus sp. TJ4]|uniref:GntR family transcriptional regulator n=1 Tax=Brevibacillus sp. TJ4 TaxID=3234853 RepID=UPI0037D71721